MDKSIKDFFSDLFSNNSDEENNFFTKEDDITFIDEIINNEQKAIYELFLNDLNLKDINRDSFKEFKSYRNFWSNHFKKLGLCYLSIRIDDAKDESPEYLDDLFNLFVGLGYAKTNKLNRIDIDMKKLENKKFELRDGFNKIFLVRLFKPANIKNIMYIYDTHIKHTTIESKDYYDIKFSITIPKNTNISIKDEIIIVVNKQTLRYKVCLESKRNELDLKKYAVVYNFLKDGQNEEDFKEKFSKNIIDDFTENNDYKMISILGISKRVSENYNLDNYQIFKSMIQKDISLPITLDKDKSLKRNDSLIKKFITLFTRQQKQGFQGINKYLKDKGLEINISNINHKLDANYYEFKNKLIRNLNGEDIEKDISYLLTRNSYSFLQNTRIPKEFYMYLLKNFEMLNLTETDKLFIKGKILDMLLNDFSFTVSKSTLNYYANILLANRTNELNFVLEKINALTSVTGTLDSELFYITNEHLTDKYLIDLYLERGITNYVLLPKGKCKLVSSENNSEFITVSAFNSYPTFKTTQIFKINSLCRYFIIHSIVKEYIEKDLKIDNYFKELAIYNSFNFENEINEIENSKKNSRLDAKFRLFDKSIPREKLKLISKIDNKSDLLSIVQSIKSTESPFILIALLEKINKLKIKEVSIAVLIEEISSINPFINETIKKVLEYQYSNGVFTENSAKAIRLLSYTDKHFEKYLIDIKIQNNEFDDKLIAAITKNFDLNGSNTWILDRAYQIYHIASIKLNILPFSFYNDISVLNQFLTNGSRQDNALKNDMTTNTKNILLSYYLFKGHITAKEYKLALDIIIASTILDTFIVTSFIEKFYKKKITFEEVATLSKIKFYLWKSSLGNCIYLNIINKTFEDEDTIFSLNISFHIDDLDIEKIEDIIFNEEMDEYLKYKTIKLFYKICVKLDYKEILVRLKVYIKANLGASQILELIKDISFISIKDAILLLLYLDIEDFYKNTCLLKNILSNFDKSRNLQIEVVFSILNILNKYHSDKPSLISACLDYTLNFKEISYTNCIFMFESLKYLDDDSKMNFINNYMQKYNNECSYSLIYKYKNLFAKDKNILNLLCQRYSQGYLDDYELKEILLEKHLKSNNNVLFLNIANRAFTSDKIENLILLKAKEKFSKDIDYVEKLINSNSLIDNKKFKSLRVHINNKINNFYSAPYSGNYKILKTNETTLVKDEALEDVFTGTTINNVEFKDAKLLNRISSYFYTEENSFIKLDKNKYKINLGNIIILNFEEKYLKDFLKKMKRFIDLINALYSDGIIIEPTANIEEYERHIFLSRCLFSDKKVEEVQYTDLLKTKIRKLVKNKEHSKFLQKDVLTPLRMTNTLVEIQKVFKNALILLTFDTISFREKIENFERFDLDTKKDIIAEIIKNNTSAGDAIKIVIKNIDLIEKNIGTLKYFLQKIYKETSLTKLEIKVITNQILTYEKEDFNSVQALDKENFIKNLEYKALYTSKNLDEIKLIIGISSNISIGEKEIEILPKNTMMKREIIKDTINEKVDVLTKNSAIMKRNFPDDMIEEKLDMTKTTELKESKSMAKAEKSISLSDWIEEKCE